MTEDGGDMTEEEACHRVERTQSHVRGTVSDLKCVLSAANRCKRIAHTAFLVPWALVSAAEVHKLGFQRLTPPSITPTPQPTCPAVSQRWLVLQKHMDKLPSILQGTFEHSLYGRKSGTSSTSHSLPSPRPLRGVTPSPRLPRGVTLTLPTQRCHPRIPPTQLSLSPRLLRGVTPSPRPPRGVTLTRPTQRCHTPLPRPLRGVTLLCTAHPEVSHSLVPHTQRYHIP